jgi:hypothetical protein
MEQSVVREVLTVTTSRVTKHDKAIGARFNQVAMMALNQAETYLLHGPEEARLAVTKSFLTAVSRLSMADTEEKLTEHRQAFLSYLATQTEVEHHLTDAESKAITATAYDQDIEPGLQEV